MKLKMEYAPLRCPFCFRVLKVLITGRDGLELAGVKSCPARGRGVAGRHAFHWIASSRAAAPRRLGRFL